MRMQNVILIKYILYNVAARIEQDAQSGNGTRNIFYKRLSRRSHIFFFFCAQFLAACSSV